MNRVWRDLLNKIIEHEILKNELLGISIAIITHIIPNKSRGLGPTTPWIKNHTLTSLYTWSYKDTNPPHPFQFLSIPTLPLSKSISHHVGEEAPPHDRKVVGVVGLKGPTGHASGRRPHRKSKRSIRHHDAVSKRLEELPPRRSWSWNCGGSW